MSDAEIALYAPLRAYLSLTAPWPITERYEKPDEYDRRWDRFIRPPDGWWVQNADAVSERRPRVSASRG